MAIDDPAARAAAGAEWRERAQRAAATRRAAPAGTAAAVRPAALSHPQCAERRAGGGRALSGTAGVPTRPANTEIAALSQLSRCRADGGRRRRRRYGRPAAAARRATRRASRSASATPASRAHRRYRRHTGGSADAPPARREVVGGANLFKNLLFFGSIRIVRRAVRFSMVFPLRRLPVISGRYYHTINIYK